VKKMIFKKTLVVTSAVALLSLTATINVKANEVTSSKQEQVASETVNQNTVKVETKDEIEAKLKVAEEKGEVSIASEKDLETLINLEEGVQEDLSNFVDNKPLEADKPSRAVRARYVRGLGEMGLLH
jgi:non-homologous end joining protein Ku